MEEKVCIYKGEQYSVKSNGEVLRHPRTGKRPRPTDNQWTFGKFNEKNGYLEIASERVHRIVATAFHGVAPTKDHVVDHIDTNRQNNRPENLRWVTRLENVLLNPITAKRIALVCGSIEAFLANPAMFRDLFPDPNYKWMSTVNTEEAQLSLHRLLSWAKSDKIPFSGSLDEWIFDRSIRDSDELDTEIDESLIIKSLTPNAGQINWNTPSEFPCCPQFENLENPIRAYYDNLKEGAVFCKNDIYFSLVLEGAITDEGQSLHIISESESGIKPWALAKVTYSKGLFLHESLGTFFSKDGVDKQFCIAQGKEWLGGDSIDDYC